ncbi:ferric reductase-like transmembrane domain-containing protein [Formosa sp. 3Alg 14/1]|uniref:ferric reductase-like transmembrane domain-containing protein n=1 Tax=Formosa sp. 3Alg 14/1 TaxID=3382190 RepID=UPI0039BE1E35
MSFLKRNYGWMIVSLLAVLPMIIIGKMIQVNVGNGLSISWVENTIGEEQTTLDMLYHISGEFAIRWMTAVLTLTPVFIIFGIQNLFVRQAMGIATAIWSILHFIIFIAAEGLLETFTQFNYIAGCIAVLILIPLLITSNRKSMKRLKKNWKKLQSLAYVAVGLSLLHVAILDKTWIIYAVIVSLGFVVRMPIVRDKFLERGKRKQGLTD